MKKIVVLGAGMVGREVARDLSRSFAVTSVDASQAALDVAAKLAPIATQRADLSTPEAIKQAVRDADLVVGALPGFLGRMALQAVIESGKNAVDIAFFPEDCFELDALAKSKGVTAIVDFGVAPGMSNVFMGYHNKRMQSVERFECLVGGLPRAREFPFEYKAVFSPADVLEEYTRPARYIEHGQLVVRPALTDPDLIDFEHIGTLEAFNTDGLRTLAQTMTAPNMKEKTLRYPGHARLMQAFRDSGFFSKEPIEIRGVKISPLEFTSRVMFPSWQLKKGQEEFTVMRVTIEGVNEAGRRERIDYDLYDKYDPVHDVTSMARTTGYSCTAAVQLLATGMFDRKGVCPPEFVAEDQKCFDFLLDHQRERNIHYKKTVTPL